LGVKLGVKLGVNEAGILELIIRNKFITIVQLAKELHISTTAVEKNLAKLKANERYGVSVARELRCARASRRLGKDELMKLRSSDVLNLVTSKLQNMSNMGSNLS